MNLKNLTAPERFAIEWQYRMLGDFKTKLMHAIMQADQDNLNKLALGFPDEVEAYRQFSLTDGWWQEVQKKAGVSDG